MGEDGEISQPQTGRREIVRRPNAISNTSNSAFIPASPEPQKTSEKTSSLKTKVLVGAAGAGLLLGGAKVIDDTTGVEAAGNDAHVSIVQEEKPPQSSVLSEVQNDEPEYFDEIFHSLIYIPAQMPYMLIKQYCS